MVDLYRTQRNIGLVGAGTMGSLHARVISQSPEARLTFVVDPNEAVGRAVAERFDVPWHPEMPDLDAVQGVVIAAATEHHVPLAQQVLNNGTALLVEKPIAASLDTSDQLLELAAANHAPMMCGLLERYNPAILTAQALLADPVHLIGARHSPYAPRIKTGVAWDLLIHDVDIAIQLLGTEPDYIAAQFGIFHGSSLPGAEDVADVVLGFPNSGIASISASRIGHRKVRELSIFERNRLIEIDLLRRGVTIYSHVSEDSLSHGRGYRQQTVIEIPELVTNVEPLAAQLQRFCALIDGNIDIDTERASYRPAHRVISAALEQGRQR